VGEIRAIKQRLDFVGEGNRAKENSRREANSEVPNKLTFDIKGEIIY